MSWRAACSSLRPRRVREQRAPARRRPGSRARRRGRFRPRRRPGSGTASGSTSARARTRCRARARRRRATTRRDGSSSAGSRMGVSPGLIATLLCACRTGVPRQRMTGLVRSLADIALLRKDPSGLPSSWASVAVFVLAYAAADIVVALTGSVQPVLARTAVDLALTLPFFWLLLAVTRRTHRFAADDQCRARRLRAAGADHRPAAAPQEPGAVERRRSGCSSPRASRSS